MTGRLNQDCVENLFSIIRSKGSKVPVDTCQDCSNQLIIPKLPSPYDELFVYEFLQNKTYQEVGCLVSATPAMITFVERLETLSSGIFEGIIHMPHIFARLFKCADDFCILFSHTEMFQRVSVNLFSITINILRNIKNWPCVDLCFITCSVVDCLSERWCCIGSAYGSCLKYRWL